ncbi:WD40 domain protein (macronuclear) [Tetrahymena thermophila SB210]|uniref:WD40 domain protein n=1 Tax=Tetrahymena thermophila (strain SB210) TaxID=312017 RepID=W7XF32_TETTS|nr:WD40 domain protein [Tetrahymena thermophila SB210]EWS76412.1 WD40 domain protein [Tetrahymena thermophila SB210]|eukprot:XP_012651036.1 WD40 domain protein [Tetrahymena thermophila SB210]
MSFQNICPFDIHLGYSSSNCQGQIGDQNILGGELLYFKNQDKYELLMVDYGSLGLLGVWNLTDASLFYSTSYYSDQNIQIHSIFTDKQINISDPSLSETFIYIIDINFNVYQQSLYQQNSMAIKFSNIKVDNQQKKIQVCFNIKNGSLYFPLDNYVFLSSIEQFSQIKLDSEVIHCESDFSQDYIYVLSSKNNIYKISQTNFEILNTLSFQLGNITHLKFQQSQGLTFISYNISGYSIFSLNQNFNQTNLLFFSPNQINDYGFLNDRSLIVCGNNSMIYFGSYFINPATQSMDYNDYHVYDSLNALLLQDLKLINYTKLIVGDDFTVFYGNQTMITVVVNENRVIQLNKCLGSQLLLGVTPNAIFEGSILKTLTSSGMLFIDITNGHIKRHTSCFQINDIPAEQVEGLYFDDELLRIYMIENQGKLGYFSFPKGEYLTQYYNLSTQSRLQFNKQGDQIYIWPFQTPQNYLVITTYLDGTFLQILNFDNDFKVSQVYFDNNLEIILVIDQRQKLQVFNSKQFNLLYDSPITNQTVQFFQSQYGPIIVYQNLIQMLTKGQDSHQIQINTLNLQNYVSNQIYFDTFSNSLILFNVVGTLQIAIIENPQNINIKSLSFLQKQNQVSQNICFGNKYLVILMASPNEIILINKQTNDLKIINFAFVIPNQCLLLLDEELLLVVPNGNQLVFIDAQSQVFLKNEQLDQLSSTVSSIQIDKEENLLIILLSTNQIISYDYLSLQQVCDWKATSQITLSTFQISTSYKKILYSSGLMIYFIDYTQKKLMKQIQFLEKTQGGVIDQQTKSIFIYTTKVYKYGLQKYNLILASQFEHLQQINQLNIIYEWNIIMTSSLDNTIAIHSYPELNFIQLLQHDPIDCQNISTFTVDVENNRIISGCGAGSIYVWKNNISINNFYLLKDYQYLQIYPITQIIIDQTNNLLILIGVDSFPLLVQLGSIDQQVDIIQVLQGNDGVYDKNNQCILTFDQDGYVWNYSLTSQSYIFRKQYPIHQGQVKTIALDPLSLLFVSTGLDNTVQIWPYYSNDFQEPFYQYTNIAQIQYGYIDMIISFSNDQTVKFWEYEFSFQSSYFQIIHRSSSIISYAFDEDNNSLYYTRSDAIIDGHQFLQSSQNSLVYNLEVQDSYFGMSFSEIKQNKYLIPDSYMIYTNSSSINLLSTFMKSQLSNSSVGLIKFNSNQLLIANFTLEENQLQNVSPIVITQSQVIVDQSYFISNKLYSTQYGGGVFYFDASLVKIQNSQFIDNEAQNGGSLYFVDMCDCLLNNVTFTNNTARESGGAFLLNDSNIQILNSTFERNKALIGGIARYLTFIPLFLKKNTSDLVKDSCGTTYQNNCIDNYGQFYGNNFCSFPQSAKINNQSLQNGSIYIFKDVQSGTQNNILKINILDEEGNQVKFQSKKNIPDRILQEFSQYYVELQELYLLNNIQDLRQIDLKLQGATIQPFEFDEFLLNQYQVSGQLGKRGRAVLQFKGFHLYSNQTQGFTDTLTIYIDYNFRNCQIGEIIQSACTSCSLENCFTCQNGTYSIEDPKSNTSNMQCKPCDYSSTISCQGSQINLKQGFWRSDKFNDEIISCTTKSQNFCNGQEDTNYCSEGFIGPLCQTCDILGQFWNNSYGRSGLDVNCYKCQSEIKQIAEQILICFITLLYLTYLFYQTKINLNMMAKVLIIDRLGLIRLGNSGQIGEENFYSRLMIRYLQIFISISSISPKPIFNFQIISIFSPNSFYYEFKKDSTVICFVFLFFFLQQSSFESLVQTFTCKKIGMKSFMNYYLLEKCYSTNHVILITSMIMPMTFLWIVLVPGILIYKIWSIYILKINYRSFLITLLTIVIFELLTIQSRVWFPNLWVQIKILFVGVFSNEFKTALSIFKDNSFKKFNNFQLLRLYIQDYIQRKKKDINAPFFSNVRPNHENSLRETDNQAYSTRKALLSKRMNKKGILKQSSQELIPNQTSPKKFLVPFNSERQTTKQNFIFSFSQSPYLNIKLSEQQNKNEIDIDSQTSENFSEYQANQQNNCQTKYNFQTRSNVKNINHDQFTELSSQIEYRYYKTNDQELDSIINDQSYAQKNQTLQYDEKE